MHYLGPTYALSKPGTAEATVVTADPRMFSEASGVQMPIMDR